MKRDIGLRGSSRRDFIKGVLSAGAVLGVGPTRVLEVLEQLGGSALADEACSKTSRSVNIIAGTGTFAWFSLLWPAPRVVTQFQSEFAFDKLDGNGKPMAYQPGSLPAGGQQLYVRRLQQSNKLLWEDYGRNKLVTAILAGKSGAHEDLPRKAFNTNTLPDGVGGAVQLFAGTAAIQKTGLKSIVPVINLQQKGDSLYGSAMGAPVPAVVANADSMVGLFSSAASRIASRLQPQANQALFDRYYKAFLGLTRTASRQTYQRAYADSSVAVGLLKNDLRVELRRDLDQVDMLLGGVRTLPGLRDFADALIVGANAFRLGLCTEVNVPVFVTDTNLLDPHGAFGNVSQTTQVVEAIGNTLQFFLDKLKQTQTPDLCPGKTLADSVVMTFSGDLPKDSFRRSGWPDDTPGDVNWIYVMSQGYLKPGWFGDIEPSGKYLFNPQTGALLEKSANSETAKVAADLKACTNAAMAGVLYAVSQGNDLRVRDFFSQGNYDALKNTPA